MNAKEYTPISIDALAVGMKIDYEIYFLNKNKFVLLCKDIILTDSIIKSLHTVASNSKNIYVPKKLHQKILRESNFIKTVQNKVTSFAEYESVKAEAGSLFAVIAKSNTVPVGVANEIAKKVKETIDRVDVSHIIERINNVRKVDEYLYTHCVNVAYLNGLIGKWGGLDERAVEKLVRIGILHDIGKLKIPPNILNKPDKLTPKEFQVIKAHPTYSYEMLRRSGETDSDTLLGVVQHHEKINGKGYPRGLSGESITTLARITAVSDVYDAMVTKRVYKEAHSPFEILEWFSEGRYSELDFKYVNKFLNCMVEELKNKYVILSDGAVAKVIYIRPDRYKFPIVEVDGEVTPTSQDLCCVCMYVESHTAATH